MRTMPADVRSKVSALLAADESAANNEFLGDAFHDDGGNQQNKKSHTAKSTRGSANVGRRSKGKAPSPSSRPKRKLAANANGKRSSSRNQPRSQKSKRSRSNSGKAIWFWLSVSGAVVVCSLLVWLITTSLTGLAPDDSETATTEPPSAEVSEDENDEVVAVDQPPSEQFTASNPLPKVEEKPFFTPAVSAPPLSPQQLDSLPKAMSPISLVTNPRQLPGVRSWTVETMGYRMWANSVAVSDDGQLAAFASLDGSIRIVNYRTGQLQKLIVEDEGKAGCLHWATTNEHLFVCSAGPNGRGARIRRFHISSGAVEHTFDAPAARVDRAFDSSGPPYLITDDKSQLYVLNGKKIEVLSTSDLSVIESFPLPQRCDGVALSPDNKFLLTSGANSVTIWNNSRPITEIATIERETMVTKHSWSSRGLVATGWRDGKVIVYDANVEGAPIVAEVQAFPLNDFYTRAICHGWLNDDIVLVTGTGASVKHVSVAKSSVVQQFENSRWHPPLCYSQKLGSGVIAGEAGRQLVRGTPKRTILEGDVSLMDCVAFSADGRFIAVSGFNQAVYDLATGVRGPLASKPTRLSYQHIQFSGRNKIVCRVDATVDIYSQHGPEGQLLGSFNLSPHRPAEAVVVQDEAGVLVRCRDGSVMQCRQGLDVAQQLAIPSNDPIQAIAWNNLRGVAVLVSSSHIYEWDPASDVVQTVARTPQGCEGSAKANSAGTHLALSGDRVVIVDAKTYSEVANYDWRRASLHWAHNGDLIAFAKRGEMLHRISLARPSEVTSIPIPFKEYTTPFGLSVSPVAPVAVAILPGNQIRFVDTRNGRHLGTIVPFGPQDYGTISPDGQIIGASDGFLRKVVYQLKTDAGQETLTPDAFANRFHKYLTQ